MEVRQGFLNSASEQFLAEQVMRALCSLGRYGLVPSDAMSAAPERTMTGDVAVTVDVRLTLTLQGVTSSCHYPATEDLAALGDVQEQAQAEALAWSGDWAARIDQALRDVDCATTVVDIDVEDIVAWSWDA